MSIKGPGRAIATSIMACLAAGYLSVPAATADIERSPAGGPPPSSELLQESLHGSAAIRALGDKLAVAASRNGKTAAELSALLRQDRSMWVDQSGLLFVKDAAPTLASAEDPEAAPFPNSQTFTLHSRPGAQRVVYLDFDGQVVSGTAWGEFSAPMPPFDTDGIPQSWSQAELDVVQSVFQRVAEDFAPFDVDVTTQDPGDEALNRSSSTDEQFGTRVLVTPSAEALQRLCGNCGGYAYIGVFNRVGSAYYQPAWVFPQRLSNNAKYIAEAASHEAGHNLGLTHDGTPTLTYYQGHGNWAPIMGVGYYEPVTQWSQGEYPDANNTQDDFAIMQSYGLTVRADDHGSTIASADALGIGTSTSGVIETRGDRDVFSISRQCSGSATIALTPAPNSPNLDASLRLLRADGTVVAASDPPSGQQTYDTATGLNALVAGNLVAGNYLVEVDGVGVLDTTTGYSDYGSLGSYSLTISSCSTVPSAPLNFSVSKDDAAQSATISWEPPASDGGSAITGYRVARDGGTPLSKNPWSKIVGPEVRSQTFLKLTPGSTFTLTVEAINAVGTGPAASGQATIAAPVTNLLKNPGFELDANADSRPDSWTSNAKFTRSSMVKYTGTYAGQHRASNNTGHTITQVVNSLTAGRNYEFSGQVNIPATTDAFTFQIRVRWRNSANTVIRSDVVRTYTATTNGWGQALRTMTSPAGTTNAQVQMVSNSLNGTVYVDDFAFRPAT